MNTASPTTAPLEGIGARSAGAHVVTWMDGTTMDGTTRCSDQKMSLPAGTVAYGVGLAAV
jgi:hypothetical protein